MRHTLWRALSLIGLLSGALLAPVPVAAAPAMTPDEAIWIITDPHYLSPTLHDDGTAFARIQATAAGKDVRYTRERMAALVQQVAQQRPAVLLVSGDLTLNGERQSSLELADFFDQIEALGTTVLVEPGNHDIADGWARGYTGDRDYPTDQVSARDFADIFARHGYDEAEDRDPASLSYLATPFDRVWFLMIDSNRYPSDGPGHGAPPTAGLVRRETLDWMDRQLARAQEAGALVIPVIHHNLLDHHDQLTQGFTVDNAPDVRALLARYPETVRFGFSGHIHTQHIAQAQLGTSQTYTEIVNGSFAIAPATIGQLTLVADSAGNGAGAEEDEEEATATAEADTSSTAAGDERAAGQAGGTFHYHRGQLDTGSWAQATGQTQPDLLHHGAYLRQVFRDASHALVAQTLAELETDASGNEGAGSDGQVAIRDLVADINLAFFAGEPLDVAAIRAHPAYQRLLTQAPEAFLTRYLQDILAESQRHPAGYLDIDLK